MFPKLRFKKLIALPLIGAMIVTACQTAPQPTQLPAAQPAATFFLVRHAEKTSDKNDPALTAQGRQRAELLADTLQDAGITRIYSSDYIRTRDTAAPLAERLGRQVEIYDVGDLQAIASKLKAEGKRALVVGHSNTTPELVDLLGGEGGEPIVEATEYDRLYVVTLGKGGNMSTTLLRYGD
ncbi:SixA phosphatase family protein [Litorimonas haliclonae]|uniref:SixA phosphatase family protein n=1 Tax=Litorimonas haliclonae TaxID=2081977 RepID=UPI0039EE337E